MSNIFWSQKAVAQLMKLASKGLTSRQIADQLGAGFTRNCVIGKARRLGIHLSGGRETDPDYQKKTAEVVRLKPRLRKKVERKIPDKTEVVTGNVVYLLGLKNNMCRYPISGDGSTTLFCGDETKEGSWCDAHRKIVFNPRPRVGRDGQKVELREKSDGLLPNAAGSSFGIAKTADQPN